MPVSNTACIGRNHVWDAGAELCRCGAFRVIGFRGMVDAKRTLYFTEDAEILGTSGGES